MNAIRRAGPAVVVAVLLWGGATVASHALAQAPIVAVTVTEKNINQTVKVPQGATLVVSLSSNRSTGFEWKVIENNAGILKPVGKAAYKPHASLKPGLPGREIYRFTAVKPGLNTLRLSYKRPADGRPAAKNAAFLVKVVPKGP